jgi:hypothetical protein
MIPDRQRKLSAVFQRAEATPKSRTANCECCGAAVDNLRSGDWWACRDQKVHSQKSRSGLKTTEVTTTTYSGVIDGSLWLCPACISRTRLKQLLRLAIAAAVAGGLFFADYWVIVHQLRPEFRGQLDLGKAAILFVLCLVLGIAGLIAGVHVFVALGGAAKPGDYLAAQLKEPELRQQGYEMAYPGHKPATDVETTTTESWHV